MSNRATRLLLVRENHSFTKDLLSHYPHLKDGFQRSTKLDWRDIQATKRPHAELTSPTEVAVYTTDTASCALHLVRNGFNPLVLNFASHRRPGGGYLGGSIAQEEALFYVSTYELMVDPALYPLNDTQCVYTPDVVVFREPKEYRVLEWGKCWTASFVAMPALNRKNRKDSPYSKQEMKETHQKVEMIAEIALQHGHDSLVLGAWGSGVFGNDPLVVARVFKEVLIESAAYRQRFKKIAFAVPGGANLEAYQLVFPPTATRPASSSVSPSTSESTLSSLTERLSLSNPSSHPSSTSSPISTPSASSSSQTTAASSGPKGQKGARTA